MSNAEIAFRPNHDENARQGFVGALKKYANVDLEQQIARLFEDKVLPAAQANGGAPTSMGEAAAWLEPHPLYHLWGNLTYHSQDMMFDSVAETATRQEAEDRAAGVQLMADRPAGGSLQLNPALSVPHPISLTEIHRQPGGYIAERDDQDLMTGMVYHGTGALYRNAKQMGGTRQSFDFVGQMMSHMIKARWPEMRPRRILDIGCGAGEQTQAYKRAFPEAEMHGVDVAAPLLRFAHVLGESSGLEIHYKQADARDTGYADGSVDLIVSSILFHETTHKILPEIMAEARRLLAPGGVFYNLDVPYQPGNTPLWKQVTNNWQVRHNGEPFWTEFARLDMAEELAKAGWRDDEIFCGYEGEGPVKYLIFGGVKTA